MRWLVLLVAVAAGPAGASGPPDAPLARSSKDFTYIPPRSVLAPSIEGLLLHGGILGFSKFITQADYAQVTGHTVLRNLRGGWRLDPDNIWVNFLGHPYHGALYFNAARSNALSFWESVPFPIVGGLLWEIAGESQHPSPNDLITTALTGVVFGEVLNRVSILLLDGELPPNALEQFGALVANPVGSFNRQVLGQRRPRSELPPLPPYDGGFRVGGVFLTPVVFEAPFAALVGLELTYGFPGARVTDKWAPFDYFRVEASVAGPENLSFDSNIRGLLVGRGFGPGDGQAGVWGLFTVFDFLSAPLFRLGATGLGPGIAYQARLAPGTLLRTTGTLSFLPMSGVGARRDTDRVRPVTELSLLYFLGPGVQATADAELRWGDAARLWVSGGVWQLGFNASAGNSDQVYSLTVAGRLKVTGGLRIGAAVTAARRHTASRGGFVQNGAVGGLFFELPFNNPGPPVPSS